jgi:Flp pilus assembly protein TadD
MGFLRRLFGGADATGTGSLQPQRLDYLNEALALERQGDFEAAVVSYRLALRDHPNDPRILQNLAIVLSRTGKLDDAVRAYRKALDLDPQLAGAHYGLGFLLLRKGDAVTAARHLRAFLGNPPRGPEAQRWIEHAESALRDIEMVPPGAAAGMEGA